MGTLHPLVSVIVITYNSSKYILETLESVRSQTYQNIELIISDDGSQDDTVVVCRKWLENSKSRFVRTHLLTVQENTGIPANCNRGIRVSKGKWIKLIAGDDAFFEDGIETFINTEKSDSFIIQTKAAIYTDSFIKEKYLGEFKICSKYSFFTLKANKQYNLLKYWTFFNAPSVFFREEIFQKILFDEEFREIEDYPFWINATKNGFHIDYLDVLSVKYRIHDNSVQRHTDLFTWKLKKYNLKLRILSKYYTKIPMLVKYYDRIKVNVSRYKYAHKVMTYTDVFFRKLFVKINNFV